MGYERPGLRGKDLGVRIRVQHSVETREASQQPGHEPGPRGIALLELRGSEAIAV